MEKIYTIEGVKREGDKVKLILVNNVVQEKPNLFDIKKLQMQMTYQTKEIQDPDRIRIPYDDWESHHWNIGDAVKITIEEV